MQLKKSLSSLKPYVAGKPFSDQVYLKLNANECPFPLPKSVYRAASKLRGIHRYQEGSGLQLRKSIEAHTGISAQQIILGNGSGELILLFLLAFLEKDKNVVIPEGTFSLYSMYSLINENACVRVPLDAKWHMNLSALKAAVTSQTGALFLCNPNNPTGHSYSYEEIEQFLSQIPSSVAVFLDEAYIHYSPFYNENKIKILIQNFSNLFVLRTFSKLGLAGVRCGYGLGNPEMIDLLQRIRPPFNVNSYALEMSAALLKETAYLREIREENFRQLDFLTKEMEALGLKVFPSHANFLLVQGPQDLDQKLESRKVLIRKAQSFGLPSDYYRMTVGNRKENSILLKRLKEVL